MNLISENSLPIIDLGLSGINIMIFCTILPLPCSPAHPTTARQLFETLFWQRVSLIGWPTAVLMGMINLLRYGAGPDLAQTS
ncbi:MAG: hypothetical protein HQ574_06955 [Chloroflexi bacterium]|nr:hypothetical protein [Chloroflexota bacterium]